MKPYEIVLKELYKRADGLHLLTPDIPRPERTWSGFATYVPGDIEHIRQIVRETRISFRADVFPAEGGAWVHAGYNDLEKLVTALRGRA